MVLPLLSITTHAIPMITSTTKLLPSFQKLLTSDNHRKAENAFPVFYQGHVGIKTKNFKEA